MKSRPRLSYANVVATLALFLVLSGGTVYAATQLGKNSVKSKHIAKGAVKKQDLGKNAVSSPKVKNKSIKSQDLAAGVFKGLDVDVAGTATASQVSDLTDPNPRSVALTGTTSFQVAPGEVGALAAEARWTIATNDPMEFCGPAIGLRVNGLETRTFIAPEEGAQSTTLVTSLGRDADGPFGLMNPNTPLEVTAELFGDDDCTPDSRLDGIQIRLIKLR